MSNVPAWKRLGLKVKEGVAEDTFAATTHFDGGVITNKVAKKLNKKRNLEEDKNGKAKKPPKRAKVPKAERGPPPEKDQLLYLRQFVHDKDQWKFSKQKQNWLLKNIESIPESYENDLIAYFEDIQGGARTRVEADLRAVIDGWNKYSKELEEKINAELYGEKTEENAPDAVDESETKSKETKKEAAPSKEYAMRCKKLLSAMLDEPVHIEGEEVDTATIGEQPAIAETETVAHNDKDLAFNSELISIQPEAEDNLIIEDVEVEEYDQRDGELSDFENTKKSSVKTTSPVAADAAEAVPEKSNGEESQKAKKDKKAKKTKKEKKAKKA